ncbi:isocitrate lyase/phosphoenolpyruvate mutase family protein [Nocardia sp. NPDC051833]|uniref:isocitrate lyase/PEP mutase family protein n=1 Tax=Nocardia sp. NPDC051833 TaxID=3155674 RepID=UPI0034376D26
MISDPELVRDLLHSAPMPPVPDAPGPGIAWLRAHVPRFCDGPVHRRRRAAVQRELDRLDPAALRVEATARAGQPLAHVRVLLKAMELPESAVTAVAVVAAAYQPHEPTTPETDAAVRELVALCAVPARVSGCTHDSADVPTAGSDTGMHSTLAGAPRRPARTAAGEAEVGDLATPGRTADTDRRTLGDGTSASEDETTDDERIAARICLLVQACAATGELIAAARAANIGAPADRPALIMATAPPLRSTRRLVDGVVTELDLRHPGLGFGAGPHRCPGHELAIALAGGVLESDTPATLSEPGGEPPLPGSAPRPTPHIPSGPSGRPATGSLPDRHLRIDPTMPPEPTPPAHPGRQPGTHQPSESHRTESHRAGSPRPDPGPVGSGGIEGPTNYRPRNRNLVDSTDFHTLHHGERPLILPNAWDFTSGALLADAGFPAIATTSLGVAAAAGLPDGKAASADETFALAARLTRLPVAVSVDIEAGFADDPTDVADYVARLADLGVAGINIEDGRDNTALATPETQADLINIIKAHVPHVFVNARVDTHWFGIDEDSTVHRARLYAAAGADGLFVPGVTDPVTLRTLVAATPLPLNTLYTPSGPDTDALAALGVRRISTGSALYRAALGAAVGLARTLRGDPGELSAPPDYRRIQALLAAANTA